MHNELLDTNAPEILEKHAENKRERNSHRNKTFITKVVDNVSKDNREFSDVPLSHQGQSNSNKNNNIDSHCGDDNDNIGEKTNTNLNTTPVNKIKIWKDLVTSQFSRRNHHNQHTDSESNNNINDDRASSKDNRKLNRSKEDSDSASKSYKLKKDHNVVINAV